MLDGTFEELRTKYIQERNQYERLAESVAEEIRQLTQKRGLRCEVTHRSKEVASFLKKALKAKYENPYSQIVDKAGVRIITYYPWIVSEIEDIVCATFNVQNYEDKRIETSFKTLSYRGTHLEIKWRSGPLELQELICEVQILTRAESLWADIAHDLSYKPAQEPPDEVQRMIYRLVALVELFDSEAERAYNSMRSIQGFQEAELLTLLERHYYQFTAKQYDRQLSLEILSILVQALPKEALNNFEPRLESFVSDNREKFFEIYERYHDDDYANPLIWQPETILIFLELQDSPFELKDVWEDAAPLELLISLANTWGTPL